MGAKKEQMIVESYFFSRGIICLSIKTIFSFINILILVEIISMVDRYGLIGILGMAHWILIIYVLGTAAAWFHVRYEELNRVYKMVKGAR